MWAPSVVAVLLCALANVNAQIYPTRFAKTTWDDYNRRLQTQSINQGHYQGRSSLANGYIGINLAALGPFFEVETPEHGDVVNGWPLFDRRQTFSTVAGFWDEQPKTMGYNFIWLDQYGGESVISGIPHWSGLIPECGGHGLRATTPLSEISGFSSTFDYKNALRSWRYTWTPPNCPALEIEYNMFVHKLHVNQAAVQLKITPSNDVNVTFIDVLDGDGAVRTNFVDAGFDPYTHTIYSAVSPHYLDNVTAWVFSTLMGDSSVDFSTLDLAVNSRFDGRNTSSTAQTVQGSLRAGKTTVVEKYLGIASSDAIQNPGAVAHNASVEASKTGYLNMLQSHMHEWHSIMTPDSIDRYQNPATGALPEDVDIVEHQILAVTNPFYILQNTVGENAIVAAGNNRELNKYSVSVSGLSSDSYAGMVFWDADVWMQPGLVLAFPESARQIANYRTAKYPQAMENIKTAFTSSQNETNFSPNSAVFSWTSSRYGNCTSTGPCFDYEYHINGDIALQLENLYHVTGDTARFKKDSFPVYDSVAQLYSDLLYLNTTTGTYMLSNATDPDEFANHVNNPSYTMVLAQTIMDRANKFRQNFGLASNSTWTKQAGAVEIPINKKAGIHLEYSGMNGFIQVKQADVVLIYDFLNRQSQYEGSDLNYYAGKQSLDGPAMTYGVFSIIAARQSPSGCSAYTYDLYGSQPYTRGPWYQYSEQLIDNYQLNGGFHPAFPFLTGMGGSNRVAPFGYLGLQLQQGSFNINPTLPPQISHLNYRTMYWQGYGIAATANKTHTSLRRLPRSLPNANAAYKNAPIPVTIGRNPAVHHLSMHAPLIFPNRRPDLEKTVPGNVAQCLSVTTSTAFALGQFPIAAVDGAVSTKWQPLFASPASSITVNLGPAGIVPITGFAFDWAQAPPKSYSITFSNSSSPSPHQIVHVASSHDVEVSNPYNPKTAGAIVPYISNTTNVTLPHPVRGGMFATLTIEGNQANMHKDAPGASVAEWAIVKEGHKALMRRYFSSD